MGWIARAPVAGNLLFDPLYQACTIAHLKPFEPPESGATHHGFRFLVGI